MIYIVNGKPGCGKTSFELMCAALIGKEPFCYTLSTIDFVKEIARSCGWNGEKTPEGRLFLSNLKDLLTRWNDVPYKKISKKIRCILDEFESFDIDPNLALIFVDCREPWEIERLCKSFGAKSLLIRRPEVENLPTSNSSDQYVMDYLYDIEINNSGTLEDLQVAAKNFLIQEGFEKLF